MPHKSAPPAKPTVRETMTAAQVRAHPHISAYTPRLVHVAHPFALVCHTPHTPPRHPHTPPPHLHPLQKKQADTAAMAAKIAAKAATAAKK